MAQGSDEGAGAAHSSWPRPRPSGGDADTPVAPTAGAAAAMTLGSILTVAGILLLFVVFAFGLATLQYCFHASRDRDVGSGRRRRGPRTAAGGSSRGGTRTSRGVDPELLRSLPVTVYHLATQGSDKGQHQQDAVECAVCLAELQDGEEARFLPRCGHGFHAECVDMWLASHTTCPLCRLTVSKPDEVSPPAPSLALPPVPPEPANYATANLPASVLLGVSEHGAVTAVTTTTDVPTNPSTLVIEIPELAVPTPTLTPCDAAKSPGSARLRSIRRLWSFGRQGAGAASSCSCPGAGASEGVDLEQGIS
ncbi:E3 ubiquitin-protein ligase EL5-like [Miscanthus floridulus]|uniref:E3 ubiquitin-protein ligase EL5-like n=1 Tax=Miscanthus floridulus TaxID=154761 RepID=UPI003458BEC1